MSGNISTDVRPSSTWTDFGETVQGDASVLKQTIGATLVGAFLFAIAHSPTRRFLISCVAKTSRAVDAVRGPVDAVLDWVSKTYLYALSTVIGYVACRALFSYFVRSNAESGNPPFVIESFLDEPTAGLIGAFIGCALGSVAFAVSVFVGFLGTVFGLLFGLFFSVVSFVLSALLGGVVGAGVPFLVASNVQIFEIAGIAVGSLGGAVVGLFAAVVSFKLGSFGGRQIGHLILASILLGFWSPLSHRSC